MPRLRLITFAALVSIAPAWASTAGASPTATRVSVTDTSVPVTDSTFVWDLDKEPSECIGFLPKPGCGKEPQQAGDRGGALQWTVFGLILAGVATVGAVLVRNVVRRDREIARRIEQDR